MDGVRSQGDAKLLALIESADDPIWSVDAGGRLIAFNHAFERRLKRSSNSCAAVGMSAEDCLPATGDSSWPDLYARAVSQGPFRKEFTFADGRTLELAFSPMVADGETLGVSVFGKDVTDRKAGEERLVATTEALRRSEERYRTTFEQAAVGIIHTSLGGRFLRCNARFAEIVGYTQEEVSNLTFSQITAAEDLDESLRTLIRMTKGEIENASWEKRYIRKDGRLTWVKLTISVQRDEDGQALHYIALAEDINERKAMEAGLEAARKSVQSSEALYRTVFQTSPDAIALARLDDGVYLEVNQAFLDFTGYKRHEVVGKKSIELHNWRDLRDRDTWLAALRADSICRNLDSSFARRDGQVYWGRLTSVVIEIDGLPCTYTIVRDITESRAAKARLSAAMEALQASEAHYRTVFQTSVDGIAISQMGDGKYVDVNRAFLELMGYEREEVLGRTSLELNFWVDPEVRKKMIEALQEKSDFRDMQTQYVRKSGQTVWVSVSGAAIEIEGVPCILSIVRDISAAKAAEERLAEAQRAKLASELRYATAFQTSLDAVNINRQSDGVYLDCNRAFLDIMGYQREDVLGRSSLELNIWADQRDRERLVDALVQGSNCQGLEVQFCKKNGEIFWGQMSASVMEVDGVPCILSITRDITDAKVAETEIRDLAFYDTLTRLPNRRLMGERLRQTLAASARGNRKGALLFIDLDNFKTLNDTLGHKMGDLLLQEVAKRLSACMREADTVARLGGDEFVVILEDLSETAQEAAAHAKTVAEKILTAIGMPCQLADHICLSTCSIGVTVFGDRKENIDDVLQQADIAMYQAKTAGRNTVRFFAPALQTAINARVSTEDDLRHAIGTNQFQLYYQPQIESGVLTGAEALLRWTHPLRGFLPPGDFIPLAEESGLILILGDWVLETACRQIALWAKRKETAQLTVAVNISARQLRQPEFVDQVLGALYRTGANPKCLILEITESMLVDDVEEVTAKMAALKSHGLSFSLDDFGIGYSSLSYLKSLPLDQLKIDRAFVRDMLVDQTSAAIAQTIISLSLAMGLSVIAEGVETEEQREFLAGHGCHSYQGYLFSPAVPLESFQQFLPNVSAQN
jgi:diguanylate cyclase (GGDEF)-like protein/PAS domain S-box-containing protein